MRKREGGKEEGRRLIIYIVRHKHNYSSQDYYCIYTTVHVYYYRLESDTSILTLHNIATERGQEHFYDSGINVPSIKLYTLDVVVVVVVCCCCLLLSFVVIVVVCCCYLLFVVIVVDVCCCV